MATRGEKLPDEGAIARAVTWRQADVRTELQILHRRVSSRFMKHRKERSEDDLQKPLFQNTHNENFCYDCVAFRGQLAGIEDAIRLFGGRKAPELTPGASEGEK